MLKVQVVRIPYVAQQLWKRIAQGVMMRETMNECADHVRSAIEKKAKIPPAQRRELLLAIDSIETPANVHEAVWFAFQNAHGAWAAAQGYTAIWIVGPTAGLTRKLA
jgi:hypothetical protein